MGLFSSLVVNPAKSGLLAKLNSPSYEYAGPRWLFRGDRFERARALAGHSFPASPSGYGTACFSAIPCVLGWPASELMTTALFVKEMDTPRFAVMNEPIVETQRMVRVMT